MAQSDDEIKMNSNETFLLEKSSAPIARSISRNFAPKDFYRESKLERPLPLDETTKASRRQFFQGLIPATGKLLINIARTVQVTVANAIDTKK